MRNKWFKLTPLLAVTVAVVALVVVFSGVVLALPTYYNVTVNMSYWDTCCNATVNGTLVKTDTTVNVSVEGLTDFPINASYNGSCNFFVGWGEMYPPAGGGPHPNVSNSSAMDTTMNVSSNTTLFIFTMTYATPVPGPTSVPANFSTVEYSSDEYVGMTFQRQNFVAHDLHWSFYINVTEEALCYRTSPDGYNWSAQTSIANYVSDWPYDERINGSQFALWYEPAPYDYVHIAMVNNSSWMGGCSLIYERARPNASGGLTSALGWQLVQAQVPLGELYAPSVCVNTSNYPFIAISAWDFMGAGPYASLYHSDTNNGAWSEHTDFPMDTFYDDLGTGHDYWISVIPVSAGNVSVQYVFDDDLGGGYMAQNYITHIGGTWTDEGATLVSTMDHTNWFEWGLANPFHSEVHIPTAENPDDIFMTFLAWDYVYYMGPVLQYNQAGDPTDLWDNGYEETLDNGSWVAAMSIFDTNNDIVLTVNNGIWGYSGDGAIYTKPFDLSTQTWGNMTELLSESDAEAWEPFIVAAYQYSSPLGFMWEFSDDPGISDLNYGWYGNFPLTPIQQTSVLLRFLLPLLLALATLFMLLKLLGTEMTMQKAAIIAMSVVIIGIVGYFVLLALL